MPKTLLRCATDTLLFCFSGTGEAVTGKTSAEANSAIEGASREACRTGHCARPSIVRLATAVLPAAAHSARRESFASESASAASRFRFSRGSPPGYYGSFTGTVLCHLAVRRCWAARAPRRQRCGASAGRSGRTGPWECGIDTHCAESTCFIQSTESRAKTGPVGRMQSHGAAAGTQSEFAGSCRAADGISRRISCRK